MTLIERLRLMSNDPIVGPLCGALLLEAAKSLETPPEVELIKPDGVTRHLRHVDTGTVYVVSRNGAFEMWLWKDGWKRIESEPQKERS